MRDDLIQPFQLDASGVRGRLVRLGPALDAVLAGHDYPDAVTTMLGETVALAAVLAGSLKYDGIFTLQTKGDGPIGLLVADVTSGGDVRASARFDAGRLEGALAEAGPGGRPVGDSVPRLLGGGYLAFTVDQGPDTDRYQGIVALEGATLAECAHQYFQQSEQIETAIKIAVGRDVRTGGWRAGALMIQRMPPLTATTSVAEEAEEDWRRAVVLMGSSRTEELLHPGLDPNDLIYRLFHEERPRVYDAKPVQARCRCSEERVVRALRSFPRAEVEDMKEGDAVVVTCEFCRAEYRFDEAALDRLYAARDAS